MFLGKSCISPVMKASLRVSQDSTKGFGVLPAVNNPYIYSKWAWTSLPGRPFAGNKGIC